MLLCVRTYCTEEQLCILCFENFRVVMESSSFTRRIMARGFVFILLSTSLAYTLQVDTNVAGTPLLVLLISFFFFG